jgi:hypothetical protein
VVYDKFTSLVSNFRRNAAPSSPQQGHTLFLRRESMFETNRAAQQSLADNVQRDPRADEGRRMVRLTRGGIVISRRLAGIAMIISVPVAAYRGVALAVEASSEGGTAYRLSLNHRDPDLDIVLAETKDSGNAAADWKYWASVLSLPRLYTENGELQSADRLQRKSALRRPRNTSVAKRRPRFLARRKPGLLKTNVFAGEREIVCYE